MEAGYCIASRGHWRELHGITFAGFDIFLDLHVASNYTSSSSSAQTHSPVQIAYVLDGPILRLEFVSLHISMVQC